MKTNDTSLSSGFLPGDSLKAGEPIVEALTVEEATSHLRSAAFNEAYDGLRRYASDAITAGQGQHAIDALTAIDAVIAMAPDADTTDIADKRAAIKQVLTALHLSAGKNAEAMQTAADTLNMLAASPKRRDEAFLSVLASLLHDVALLHSARGEYRQAEREVEKSMKILERLARTDPRRYASALVMAQGSVTQVMHSRMKQANLLAHTQAAVETYMAMVAAKVPDATDRLVDSLAEEGHTLARMDKHRQAVQYYTRALKYLVDIEPEMTLRQLTLSIDLGESLLNIKGQRDKGVHLLNTMLHKATRLGADDQHRRIVGILLNANTRRLDILGLWHKLFPR